MDWSRKIVTSPALIWPSSVPRVMSGSLPGSISRCMMSWYFMPAADQAARRSVAAVEAHEQVVGLVTPTAFFAVLDHVVGHGVVDVEQRGRQLASRRWPCIRSARRRCPPRRRPESARARR